MSIYTLVLCTMLWRATSRVEQLEQRSAWLTLAGATSFAVSDTLIAFTRFGGADFDADLRGSTAWCLAIMTLYWLGQWGIAPPHRVQLGVASSAGDPASKTLG